MKGIHGLRACANIPGEALIKLVNVTKRYRIATAVDDVSLEIERGQSLALLGPNGSGKSTILRMIMGLTTPSEGHITVAGDIVSHGSFAHRQHIGFAPEIHHIDRSMKVADVLWFARSVYNNWNVKLADTICDILSLPLGKRVKELSKGSLAKLALVIATSHEPSILILDEPFSGLDAVARDDLITYVISPMIGNCTLLYSSHHFEDVGRLAERIAILREGRLLMSGFTEHLVASAKRLRIPGVGNVPSGWRLKEVVRLWVEDGALMMTVANMSSQLADEISRRLPHCHVELNDVDLETFFIDCVRGAGSGKELHRI